MADGAKDAAAAAAAAVAARINAMLAAQGKLAKPTSATAAPATAASAAKPVANKLPSAEFSQEIEINDIPNRYLLTKGQTHDDIEAETGAAVTTKGRYMNPLDKITATHQGEDRPLYLLIQAKTQEALDAAVARVRDLVAQASRPVHPGAGPGGFVPQGPGGASVTDKVYMPFESVPGFNVKAKFIGPGGSYVKHIERESGARIQLRGRGSGYLEPVSGKEAFEPLHVHVSHGTQAGVDAAKGLVNSLIETIQAEYNTFTQARQPASYPPAYAQPSYPAPAPYPPGAYPPPRVPPPPPGVPGAPPPGVPPPGAPPPTYGYGPYGAYGAAPPPPPPPGPAPPPPQGSAYGVPPDGYPPQGAYYAQPPPPPPPHSAYGAPYGQGYTAPYYAPPVHQAPPPPPPPADARRRNGNELPENVTVTDVDVNAALNSYGPTRPTEADYTRNTLPEADAVVESQGRKRTADEADDASEGTGVERTAKRPRADESDAVNAHASTAQHSIIPPRPFWAAPSESVVSTKATTDADEAAAKYERLMAELGIPQK